MTGSVALDVVIGLIFIYLLYSLLATVLCEIIAHHLGLRARNLKWSIRRMLEDTPRISENKIVAFLKQQWLGIYGFFVQEEGPATCVFYHLPVIKYLGKNTLHSKPSYMTRQNFSKALMEIFRTYGGDDSRTDLEKVQVVLTGSLEYYGVLQEIQDVLNKNVTAGEGTIANTNNPAAAVVDYAALRKEIVEVLGRSSAEAWHDPVREKFLTRIKKITASGKSDKAVIYEIDELLNLFGRETRSHLQSLLKDANNDLVKFRLLLEQWFDDTMERSIGWYKQKIQVVLLIVGFFLALAFNANTFDIVNKLSVDQDARDKLVQMATDYANDPSKVPPRSGAPDTAALRSDTLWRARLDSLEKVRVQLQKDVRAANSVLGLGWNLPDSLDLVDDKGLTARKDKGENRFITITLDSIRESGLDSTYKKRILVVPRVWQEYILNYLTDKDDDSAYERYNRSATKIKLDNSTAARIGYALRTIFTTAFWGFLTTAIAISMGAPFWFDLLNKLVKLRSSFREPVKNPAGDAAPGADPSTQALNRKG